MALKGRDFLLVVVGCPSQWVASTKQTELVEAVVERNSGNRDTKGTERPFLGRFSYAMLSDVTTTLL